MLVGISQRPDIPEAVPPKLRATPSLKSLPSSSPSPSVSSLPEPPIPGPPHNAGLLTHLDPIYCPAIAAALAGTCTERL
jgi:hypothetical protein